MSRYLNEALVWGTLKRIPHIDRQAVLQALKKISSADVDEVRHGYDVAEYPSEFKCSLCGWYCWDIYSATTSTYNYCPNCGAKMDGGDEE